MARSSDRGAAVLLLVINQYKGVGMKISVCNSNGVEMMSRSFEDRFVNLIHGIISPYQTLFPTICEITSGSQYYREFSSQDAAFLLKEVSLLANYPIDASDLDKSFVADFSEALSWACFASIRYKIPIGIELELPREAWVPSPQDLQGSFFPIQPIRGYPTWWG